MLDDLLKCKTCQSRNSDIWSVQLGYYDEGATLTIYCLKCNKITSLVEQMYKQIKKIKLCI